MKARLWFTGKETDHARRYCRLPKSRGPGDDAPDNPNYLWVPKSLQDQTTKYPPADGDNPMHVLTIPDWFADRENL